MVVANVNDGMKNRSTTTVSVLETKGILGTKEAFIPTTKGSEGSSPRYKRSVQYYERFDGFASFLGASAIRGGSPKVDFEGRFRRSVSVAVRIITVLSRDISSACTKLVHVYVKCRFVARRLMNTMRPK